MAASLPPPRDNGSGDVFCGSEYECLFVLVEKFIIALARLFVRQSQGLLPRSFAAERKSSSCASLLSPARKNFAVCYT